MNTRLVFAALALLTAISVRDRPLAAQGAKARVRPGNPITDRRQFPIAVWLQSPENAERFKAAGINLFVGLWQGPTEPQLATLTKASMPVVCEMNETALAHRNDPIIAAWMHGDEPDNAQPIKDPKTGQEGYGPCIPPAKIVADYKRLRATDPSRPILLNLGQGVANDKWVGRGAGAKLSDYETYVNGGDIVSFDVYPVAGMHSEDDLWFVPKGLDRLAGWTQGKRRIWNCIECTRIDGEKRPTPHQVRAEVWMSIIHGSTGLIYFVHQFKPRFNEHALLDDPEMLPAVTALNRQVQELAPVLHMPTLREAASVRSQTASVPIDLMVKQAGTSLYLFAVGMRNGATKGEFSVMGLPDGATVEVIGEGRTLKALRNRFSDSFKPYDVHLYRIRR